MIDALMQELKAAVRVLTRDRAFSAAAIAVLALGLGVNTAIFSVVDAVWFRPLPYPGSDRLVMIWETVQGMDYSRFDNPEETRKLRHWMATTREFDRWLERAKTLEHMAGWVPFESTISGPAEPERLSGAAVTPAFFRLLSARTVLGRTFLLEEDRPGSDRLIVLSHGYWRRAFGGDTRVLGRTVNVDAVPHTIIGIMEPGFATVLPNVRAHPDYYVTLSHCLNGPPGRQFAVMYTGGSLRPGVSLPRAQAEMSAIAAGIERERPRRNGQWGIELVPLAAEVSQSARPAMIVLLGAVGCVLLICCANLANLSLSRTSARQRETCLRAALGCSRRRLAASSLIQSLLIALAGGVAGVVLARLSLPLLVAAIPPESLPRMEDITVDMRVFGFGFAASLLTGLLLGIVPAAATARWSVHGLATTMKDGGGSGAGGRGRRLRSAFVVAQFSLALILLTAAGLLVRGFVRMRSVDLGFSAGNVITAGITLPEAKYSGMQKIAEPIEEIVERVRSIPGIEAAAIANSIPLSHTSIVSLNGVEAEGGNQDAPAGYRVVTPDFFRVLGMPLKKGRVFTASDARGSFAIVNETFARRAWPNEAGRPQGPIGRHLKWNNYSWEVIGVVGDVKFDGLDGDSSAEIYVPHTLNLSNSLALLVRTPRPPSQVVPALRSAVRSVDRELPLERSETMEQVVGRELAKPAFHMAMVAAFAVLALLLAGVGLYAVVSYSVAQRTREIGIRMALGASRQNVLRTVMVEAVVLAAMGVAVGIAGALAATRLLTSLLFGVKPIDPPTFAAAAALLVGVSVLAAWVPARRAISVDPSTALRCE